MLRRLGVRGKIYATLAVPVLVLFIGATILSVGSISASRLALATSQVVNSLPAQDAFTEALQAERAAAFDFTMRRKDAEAAYRETLKATDAAAGALNIQVDKIDQSPLDKRLVDALAASRAARTLNQLDRVRDLFLTNSNELPKTVEAQYGVIIAAQAEVALAAADRMPDRDLGRLFDAYNRIDATINYFSLDAKLVENYIDVELEGEATEEARRNLALEIIEGDNAREGARDIFVQLALPGVRMPNEFPAYSFLRSNFAASSSKDVTPSLRKTWPGLASDELKAMKPTREQIRDITISEASAKSASETRTTFLTILIVALGLIASVVIAGLVSRRITGPLRRLTAAATHVRSELPKLVDQVAVPGKGPELDFDRIPVEDNDEVGQLANAFNDVNETTLDIARQQAILRGSIAEMFVNVARRDQVLLGRQLEFLDELERSEEDPNTLANLFRLDHLSTRMRRNAESLLVLAGIESGRRVRDPMSLSDVIRTAASEIEHYDRVQLQIQTDPLILGHNALVAAHLLAELLENATIFSDPGSPVLVSESEDEQWISIVVRDQGLGMSPEDLILANEKASTYAGGEIAGASRLGLFVVGRLAHRLGANVHFSNLDHEGGTGIEVRVLFPRALFLADSDVPLLPPTDPLSAQTQAATDAWVGDGVSQDRALPSRRPAASSQPIDEIEPPVGIPVDLDALTDGQTALGMPRRKSRAADPGALAPSQALSNVDQDERNLVLPALESPVLPAAFTAGADTAWSPSSLPAPAASGLPSRSPTMTPTPLLAEIAPGVPAPAPQRASMFANFRTSRNLDGAQVAPDEVETPTSADAGSQPDAAQSLEGPEQPSVESQDSPQLGAEAPPAYAHTQQIDISTLPTRAARRRAASAMLREGEPVFGFHNRPADAPTLGGNTGAHPIVEAPTVTGQHAAVAAPDRAVRERGHDAVQVPDLEIPGLHVPGLDPLGTPVPSAEGMPPSFEPVYDDSPVVEHEGGSEFPGFAPEQGFNPDGAVAPDYGVSDEAGLAPSADQQWAQQADDQVPALAGSGGFNAGQGEDGFGVDAPGLAQTHDVDFTPSGQEAFAPEQGGDANNSAPEFAPGSGFESAVLPNVSEPLPQFSELLGSNVAPKPEADKPRERRGLFGLGRKRGGAQAGAKGKEKAKDKAKAEHKPTQASSSAFMPNEGTSQQAPNATWHQPAPAAYAPANEAADFAPASGDLGGSGSMPATPPAPGGGSFAGPAQGGDVAPQRASSVPAAE